MKFLCDRCKTRYSIGDDRVRGKILKIRCKNCANIITVREGMTVADDGGGERRNRPTTGAPFEGQTAPAMPPQFAAASPAGPAGNSALASAFAQQLAKPPPALDEEWYVSIDGVQSGPFGLAEAQRWVAAKPGDAELHCWSEGFDDWLPVDKVSHFRGLRKRSPSAPPPPRTSTVQIEKIDLVEEPKPLFAATMASLERAAAASAPAPIATIASVAPGAPVPLATVVTAPPSPASSAAMTTPMAAKAPTKTVIGVGGRESSAQIPLGSTAPGAGVPPKLNGTGPAMVPRMPTPMPLPAVPSTPATATPVVPAAKFNGTGPSPAQTALAAAFDVGSEPHARDARDNGGDAFAGMPARAAAPATTPAAGDDDHLDIGEVSRVVNLADLARQHKPRASTAALRRTASVPKLDPAALGLGTASSPSIAVPNLTGPQQLLDPASAALADNSAVAPNVAQQHRRGLIMLIGVAAALLIGVAVLVVLMMNKSDDDLGGPNGLAHVQDIDMSRPDEVARVAAHMEPAPDGSGAAKLQPQPHKITPKLTPNLPPPDTTDTLGQHLSADEIEDMARKQSAGTQRCYMRAQRGADGIELGDVKKIYVTLAIDKTGTVTDVQLSDHATDTLGTCLQNMIKRWKFRESVGGSFKIALALAEN